MIDVLIVGSSRPDFLEKSFFSFKKRVDTKNEFRFLFHEDIIDQDKSKQSVGFGLNYFNTVISDRPRLGQVDSTERLLNIANSKYLIYWEEDWELLEDIHLDLLIKIMDENRNINQIAFPKKTLNENQISKYPVTICKRDIYLTTTLRWVSMPAIWRTDFIKSAWERAIRYKNSVEFMKTSYNINQWWICRALNEGHQNQDAVWVSLNLGSYFIGEKGSGPIIKHLGKISAKNGVLEKRKGS